MSAYVQFPENYSLTQERDNLTRQTERITDLFLGLTVLLGCVGTLILAAGFYLQAPIFTLSAAFALSAAVAFAFSSRRMARLGRIVQAKPIAQPTRYSRAPIPLRRAA
jgi:predicted permease